MKRIIFVSTLFSAMAAVLLMTPPRTKATVGCAPTGFFRDSINMTAALINPPSVTGVVDATGCNIGVYYGPGSQGLIRNADIFGANSFGVLANGDDDDVTLDILSSNIHNIGENPRNGTQHGVAI